MKASAGCRRHRGALSLPAGHALRNRHRRRCVRRVARRSARPGGLGGHAGGPVRAGPRSRRVGWRDAADPLLARPRGLLCALRAPGARAVARVGRGRAGGVGRGLVRAPRGRLGGGQRAGAARGRHPGRADVAGAEAAAPGGGRAALEADHVIWACGAWLGRLFPELIPTRVTFQQLVLFEAPPEWNGPGWVDFDGAFYGHTRVEGVGFKVGPDMDGAEVDPDTRPLEATAEGIAIAREYLAHRFPSLGDAPVASAPGCHYGLTPDGQFLFARHPQHDNVWLLGGGSGHGYKHGPALAEHVEAVLTGREKPEPRFALGERAPARSLRTAGATP